MADDSAYGSSYILNNALKSQRGYNFEYDYINNFFHHEKERLRRENELLINQIKELKQINKKLYSKINQKHPVLWKVLIKNWKLKRAIRKKKLTRKNNSNIRLNIFGILLYEKTYNENI